eukprot:scaffold357_cov66-Phaeocystis_antarctica.AAC.1
MPLETSLGANGIMTITFANQKKLNAWTQPMMQGFFDCLQEAGNRSDVAGVVVTGEGKYYSAGVDLSNVMKPMLPSNLVIYLRDSNQKVFQTVIDFPKPIVAAVNGPALGAAVTTATLMGASRHLPPRAAPSAAQPPPRCPRCPASSAAQRPPPPSVLPFGRGRQHRRLRGCHLLAALRQAGRASRGLLLGALRRAHGRGHRPAHPRPRGVGAHRGAGQGGGLPHRG